jgi:cytochrome c
MEPATGYLGELALAPTACRGKLSGRLAVVIVASGLAAGVSLAAGQTAAEQQEYPDAFEVCTSCHTYHENEAPLVGPPLWGVVGRPVASAKGYEYSPALRALGGTWDLARLDAFLTKPDAYAPGTRMDMGGIPDTDERAEVLDFLATLGPSVSAAGDAAGGPP